jgi:hypothetical protein
MSGPPLAGLLAVWGLAALRAQSVFLVTLKPRFNKSEGIKDFAIYSRVFAITGDLYYEMNYRRA